MMLSGAFALLAACSQPADKAATNAAANVAGAPEAKTPFCFFKDEATKGWSASTDKAGNVVVKGKAYRQDSRYKAVLGQPKVTGTTAEVWPTIVINDGRFGAPDDWWDVSATIPNSAAVASVQVRCGKKVVADLMVPRKT